MAMVVALVHGSGNGRNCRTRIRRRRRLSHLDPVTVPSPSPFSLLSTLRGGNVSASESHAMSLMCGMAHIAELMACMESKSLARRGMRGMARITTAE
ncbi:hypothetical protein E2562_016472 [Oryza meyeriana var. granulata]|uniref:Uncharacterized protein n=1 Tax=Oryza meyeriana var. granulata TaxID=110450 RepID=A0A6G1BLJ2_9ORYZ|nr:hypothetical protein E2562_016472 [Oryza meyeriana var. granulata]